MHVTKFKLPIKLMAQCDLEFHVGGSYRRIRLVFYTADLRHMHLD
jgi:hypothetical protein